MDIHPKPLRHNPDNPIFQRPAVPSPEVISAGQKRLNEEQPLELAAPAEPLSVEQAAENYNAALKEATGS